MSQIEEITKLYAKDKEYKIPAEPKAGEVQATIVVKQLEIDNMSVFDQKPDATPEDNLEQIYKMFELSLGLTKDESKKISVAYMIELVNAIMDANNISAEEQEGSPIKKFLKKKNQQIAEKNETEKNGVTA